MTIAVNLGANHSNYQTLAIQFKQLGDGPTGRRTEEAVAPPFASVTALATDGTSGQLAQPYPSKERTYFGITLIGAEMPAFVSGPAAVVSFPAGVDPSKIEIDFDAAHTYLEADRGFARLKMK